MDPARLQPLTADDPARVGGFELLGRLGDDDPRSPATGYLARAGDGRTATLLLARGDGPCDRFGSVVRAAHAIGGRHAAEVLAAEESGDRPWLATEHLPGPRLTDAVAEHGPLSGAAVRALAAPLARALDAARRAGAPRPRLTPGGVTLAESEPMVTVTDVTDGPADDVRALGATLLYAATGDIDPPDLSAVPPEVRPLVARLLAAEPHRGPDPARIAEGPGGPSRRTTVLAAAGSVVGAALAGIAAALVRGRPPTAAGAGANPSSPLPVTPTETRPPGVAPRPLWTYAKGPPGDAPPLPVDQRTVVLAGTDGSLTGLDCASGQRRWRTAAFRPAAEAQLTGDGLVAGQARDTGPPTLAALDSTRGHRRWELPLPSGFAPIGGGVLASDTETCYVAAARRDTVCLFAYDLATREQRWRTRLPRADRTATPQATVDRARLLVVDGGYLTAYDTRDGRQLARTRLGGERDGRPAADGTRAYVSTGCGIAAVDLGAGRIAWRTADTSRSAGYGDTAVLGGVVYATERSAGLLALDADSGRRLWSCAAPVPPLTADAPVVYRDRVYAATGDDQVWISAFDLNRRRAAWSYRSTRTGSGRTRIAFLDERLFVRNGVILQALPMD
ncbi:outer membrane protein assembly factor BamB family protein [Streptomyces silvisoli]|uniref:PQQ-binding-like beta-propeller repeat protein n=1 Tax=Streptomyces silvisoli TaxID=3034235 RepID=A0ABT5ZIB6_9ACTN|nr:PQQ-binding-like beta-propeller repeat protein [Streptomyces silvisoli]MDF3289421.1 PQQ-binding-like beta-propeller repeat protein [Streptomyces silvisoli]